MPPPPGFDAWFAYARANGYPTPDEFDQARDALAPFWGVPPAVLRARVRAALEDAAGNALLGVRVRGGRVARVDGPGIGGGGEDVPDDGGESEAGSG